MNISSSSPPCWDIYTFPWGVASLFFFYGAWCLHISGDHFIMQDSHIPAVTWCGQIAPVSSIISKTSDSIARGSVKVGQEAVRFLFQLLILPPPPYIKSDLLPWNSRRAIKSPARERGEEESLRAIYKPLRAILKSLQSNSPSSGLRRWLWLRGRREFI